MCVCVLVHLFTPLVVVKATIPLSLSFIPFFLFHRFCECIRHVSKWRKGNSIHHSSLLGGRLCEFIPKKNNNRMNRLISLNQSKQFRMIELDSKSLNSLAGTATSTASGHSRRSSDASQISLNSGKTIILHIILFLWHSLELRLAASWCSDSIEKEKRLSLVSFQSRTWIPCVSWPCLSGLSETSFFKS